MMEPIQVNDIKVDQDIREGAIEGKDVDTYSPILHQYHHALWNRGPLKDLVISTSKKGPFKFKHGLNKEEWVYSSDAIIHTYKDWKKLALIKEELTQEELNEIENIHSLGNQIAGYVIFPGKQINKKQTINQRRGILSSISDRFDLTLECIRRSYEGDDDHPLGETLRVYWSFFEQFSTFKYYVEFFLLDDLVELKEGKALIKFWHPFNHQYFAESPALPQNKQDYLHFLRNVKNFVINRRERINRFISGVINHS